MAENSKIEWTDHTFNPWRGCQHATLPDGSAHPGCEHCYAEALGKRNPAVLGTWGEQGTRVCAAAEYWRWPILWNKAAEKCGRRLRVFCASLADVFEDWTGPIVSPQGRRLWRQGNVSDPAEWVDERLPDDASSVPLSEEELRAGNFYPLSMLDLRFRLFWTIDATPWLDWLLLTKRPQNVERMWPERRDIEYVAEAGRLNDYALARRDNVCLGTSISDQATADVLVPALLKCRDLVPTLFLSVEPLLGFIDLSQSCINVSRETQGLDGPYMSPCHAGIDWVIVGGESGHSARPMHPGWVRGLRDQCHAAGVPFFFKQWGEWRPIRVDNDRGTVATIGPDAALGTSANGRLCAIDHAGNRRIMHRSGKKTAGRLLDGREWNEFPAGHTGSSSLAKG